MIAAMAAAADAAAAEVRAAATGVGLFALPDRGVVDVSGGDRISFLHGLISIDVKQLAGAGPGVGAAAFFLNSTGHVVADLVVLVLPETLRLLPGPGLAGRIGADFEKVHFTEKVTIADVSAAFVRVGAVGPRAADAVGAACAVNAAALAEFAHAHGRCGPTPVQVVRGRLGLEVIAPLQAAQAVRGALRQAADADADAVELSPAALEILRVQAGIPQAPAEINETVLGPELNLPQALSTAKCYPGQEVVARIASRGHVNRTLRGLRIDGDTVPSVGDEVRAAGRKVATVTSAVGSPTLGPIALALVRREAATPGTAVEVMHAGAALAAKVAALPFGVGAE
jgi:folate-binding protein YgfZ